jgi:pimeloyl-ACP methyl ester carboxylesterase
MAAMRFRSSDVELEWEVCGDGPQLVWLHGLTENLESSRAMCEQLARDYRVLWFSSRGHGRSSPVMERARYTYDLMADDLALLCDHAGFDRPVLAGGSHGANTILRHQTRHPGRARGLLLVAPGGNALRRPRRTTWAVVRAHTLLAARRGDDAVIKAITGHDPRDPAHDTVRVAAARTHDMPSLLHAMRFVPDQQVVASGALTRFAVPTVVAAWPSDRLIHPIAVARRIAALIPHAEFVEISRDAAASADVAAAVVGDLLRRLPTAVAGG